MGYWNAFDINLVTSLLRCWAFFTSMAEDLLHRFLIFLVLYPRWYSSLTLVISLSVAVVLELIFPNQWFCQTFNYYVFILCSCGKCLPFELLMWHCAWVYLIIFLLLLMQVILSPDADPPVVRIMDYKYDMHSQTFFCFLFLMVDALWCFDKILLWDLVDIYFLMDTYYILLIWG